MLYRTVAAALAITLIALLNGCAVTVGYEEPLDEPAVGSRVMVQQRTAAAAVQTPEPPKPPKEPEPDGDAIKKALKNGGEVEGARLQQNFHIQIKEGGVRAAKNARLRSDKRVKRITENEMAA